MKKKNNMNERKIKTICEMAGWNYEKENNIYSIKLQSEGFLYCDRNRPNESFVYELTFHSATDVMEWAQKEDDFDPSEYAYHLQEEYLLVQHPEMVVPPVISVAKFAEKIQQKIVCLKTLLVENSNMTPFETKIADIASEEEFETLVSHKTMTDDYTFAYNGLRLFAFISHAFDEDGYYDASDKDKAEMLYQSLMEGLLDIHFFQEDVQNDIDDRGLELAYRISDEFGLDHKRSNDDENEDW